MSKHFSHLVWLGAGTASEPVDLLEVAERVTLIEAREAACLSLKQRYPQEKISVTQRLLTADGADVKFAEYNLGEYSAIQHPTGLKKLFPGLKAINSELLSGTRVTDAIHDLALNDQNNVLVADIADSNFILLSALQQSDQLARFAEIHVQAGCEPLYDGAATAAEITTFLQEHGYLLQQVNKHDPDIPWLKFGLNPLWQSLQEANKASSSLNKELKKIKQEIKEKQQIYDLLNKNYNLCMQKFASQQELSVQEHRKMIDNLRSDFEQISKTAASRKELIEKIEKENVALKSDKKELNNQLKYLQQEIIKAEAQIELIKDIFIMGQ